MIMHNCYNLGISNISSIDENNDGVGLSRSWIVFCHWRFSLAKI